MPLIAGSCVVFERDRRRYLYILITHPEGKPSRGLFLTFEPLDSALSDSTLVLCGEHSYFRTPTAVKYSAARVLCVEHIEAAANHPSSGVYMHREPQCSDDLLNKLREGLFKSPYVPLKIRNYC